MSANQEFLHSLPRIGITVGDAAGIGPEIVLKALADRNIRRTYKPVIICDERSLRSQADLLGIPLDTGQSEDGSAEIIDLKNLVSEVRHGEESAETGKASGQYIEKAVEL